MGWVYTDRTVCNSAEEGDNPSRSALTLLLNRMQRGDREAAEKAAELIYGELHRLASREIRHEKQGHILQTTALVNEAYLRLAGSASLEFQNRGHFFAVASRQMRRILVDYARADRAPSRAGGAITVGLDTVRIAVEAQSIDVLVLDEALQALERLDPRAAQVVESHYFAGYEYEEIAEALGVSFSTVRRDWDFAKAWLHDFMNGQGK